MTHSLEELKSGKLLGSRTLKMPCGLKEFPEEILSLSDTLEVLDLSDNKISELPDEVTQLKKLKIIFFARNNFTVFPTILSELPALSMVGFKSNQIENVPENVFPPLLRWLILTDNKIKKIPKSIGECLMLQKCGLAGNLIEELPVEMGKCVNLELLRISANKLKSLPEWLFELPKLSWIAFSGNPAVKNQKENTSFESYDWADFKMKELLGEGASGMISKAKWTSKNEDIAVKVFKGDVTTDGLPKDEMDVSIAAGQHEHLIPVLGEIKNHPEGKPGLIMKLISSDFNNLGNPPNFDTCTRDVFDVDLSFNKSEVLKLAISLASVASFLHRKGINHGDFYAHNILVNATSDCLLGDFGAATMYDINSANAHNIERVEVRAFGCLLEDLINLAKEDVDVLFQNKWNDLIITCTNPTVKDRPSFIEVLAILKSF